MRYIDSCLKPYICVRRNEIVDLLRKSGDDWTKAVSERNVVALHEIANVLLMTNVTPAEFLKSHGLGKKTVASTIERFGDDRLAAKLAKESNFLYFRVHLLRLVVGTHLLEVAR